jgi:hypothetical protein
VAALVVASVLGAAAADDAADAAPLVWDAPASCPTQAELEARVAHHLGRALDDAAPPMTVQITTGPGGFAARIEVGAMLDGEDRVRTLTSASCARLVDAVAVILARAVRERAEAPAEVVELVAAPPAVAAVAVTVPPPVAHPPPPAARDVAIALRASGLSGIGGVPLVGVGGELTATTRWADTLIEVGIARWSDSSVYRASGVMAIGLEAAVVRIGWRPTHREIRGWLVGELGSIGGAETAVNQATQRGRWSALGTGFGVAWPFAEHVALVGAVEFLVPLDRTQFIGGDGAVLYQPGGLASHASLGLEVGWR